jgi:hypothetical protein
MTIRIMGTCHGGQITRSGRYKHPQTGQMEVGIYYEPCPNCDGNGCELPADALNSAVHAALDEQAR